MIVIPAWNAVTDPCRTALTVKPVSSYRMLSDITFDKFVNDWMSRLFTESRETGWKFNKMIRKHKRYEILTQILGGYIR